MSALGAISGNAVFSILEFRGRQFKVAQWFNDAMDAVCQAAFLQACRAASWLGGTEQSVAQREVAMARTFALGGFSFDSIVQDGGLDHNHDLLVTFLYPLLYKHDQTVTRQLAQEMVSEAKQAVVDAIRNANPQNGQRQDNGPTAPTSPVLSANPGNPSEAAGKTSGV